MIILSEEPVSSKYQGRVAIVDASVVIDFMLETEPRHNDAIRLVKFFKEHQIRARVPYHAAFEIQSGSRRSAWYEHGRPAKHAHKDYKGLVLQLYAVPIDYTFVQHYMTSDLPYLKAGDLLYLAMAKTDNVPLITEDQGLYDKARKADVLVYRISEYVLSQV